MDLITSMARKNNQTLIIVTHDIDIAKYADRTFYIRRWKLRKLKTNSARI